MKTELSREEKIEVLAAWQKSAQEMHALLDVAFEFISEESPAIQAVLRMEDSYISLVSLMVGDDCGACQWFAYECLYGAQPGNALCGAGTMVVNSVASLLTAIEDDPHAKQTAN